MRASRPTRSISRRPGPCGKRSRTGDRTETAGASTARGRTSGRRTAAAVVQRPDSEQLVGRRRSRRGTSASSPAVARPARRVSRSRGGGLTAGPPTSTWWSRATRRHWRSGWVALRSRASDHGGGVKVGGQKKQKKRGGGGETSAPPSRSASAAHHPRPPGRRRRPPILCTKACSSAPTLGLGVCWLTRRAGRATAGDDADVPRRLRRRPTSCSLSGRCTTAAAVRRPLRSTSCRARTCFSVRSPVRPRFPHGGPSGDAAG